MSGSVWNPANVQDIAESAGIATLNADVTSALTGDIEFRISQVLDEAIRFMKHGKRTLLTTQDISHALKTLDVEPLYGYESTRPLLFGEASLGPAQPLFYVSDEEIDFEKLINAALPKVPRELTMTAHWLAVEGVQPSIPQNPTSASETGSQKNGTTELLPKGAGANPYLPALTGMDNPSVKPLVKHVVSQELQLYFGKITQALLDETSEEYRSAAMSSLKSDPGLHQLLPYFVQFIAEKVTHNLGDLFVLTMVLSMAECLLENKALLVDPYIGGLIAPILTCVLSPKIGAKEQTNPALANKPLDHYALRNLAAAILGRIAHTYSKSLQSLKPRLVRTFLKDWLDPKKPLCVHYGALRGLNAVAGRDAIAQLVLPNLNEYSVLIQEAKNKGPPSDKDAEMVTGAILESLEMLEVNEITGTSGNVANGQGPALKAHIMEKLGSVIGTRYIKQIGL